ncbi:MAG: hypothetical protein RL226_1721 [Bacteroidota bacterium]
MYLHREGRSILLGWSTLLIALGVFSYSMLGIGPWFFAVVIVLLALFGIVAQFFRVPKRVCSASPDQIVSPSDGKVVVIEEVEEPEYFKGKRIQVSVFMSPLNVHVQWTPMAGEVTYAKYHPGLFLVAWHPKSSTENERTTIAIKNDRHEVMFRQIAGAVARRIRFYVKPGDKVKQAQECGFIKFGSRIDIFLPLDAEINVKLGDKVQGMQTVIARLK